MLTAKLDRRVRTEATALTNAARLALRFKRDLRGKSGDLESALHEVDAGLVAGDLTRVRRGLPRLDALVDELVKEPEKSLARDYIESIGSAILIALALRAMALAAFEIPSSSMYPTVVINDHIFVNKLAYGLHIPFTSSELFSWRTPSRGDVIVFIMPCMPDRDFIKRVVATAGQSVEVRCNVVYVDGKPIENHLVPGSCSYDDQVEGTTQWFPRQCSEYTETVNGHEYHTYQDPDRPRRDRELATEGFLPSPDGRDFPILSGARMPPSCPRNPDGTPQIPTNQQTGKIVQTKAAGGACELQLHYVVPDDHVFVMGDNRANSQDSRYFGSVPVENIRGKALFIWLAYRDWSPLSWGGVRWKRMGSFVQ